MTSAPPRPPRVFEGDDPSLIVVEEPSAPSQAADRDATDPEAIAGPAERPPRRGIAWGSILASAMAGLVAIALTGWIVDFVSHAILRGDWIGQIALALIAVALLATLAIVVRETAAIMRLNRLARMRAEIGMAIELADVRRERAALRELVATIDGRADLKWSLARFREHERDVADPGDLARLADREILAPLDQRARRAVLASAKRVSVLTALSPVALIAVLFVLAENVRMLRAVATLYGGRPGLMSALKLGRMVVTHLVATGGLALTDDLLGQVLGHDLIRRLSRRLGEGAFNGAMTARVGTAAIHVTRPLPFLEAPPVRARDFIVELFRRAPATRPQA